MNEAEEKAYTSGQRALAARMISVLARELGHDDPVRKYADLVSERQSVLVVLRDMALQLGVDNVDDDEHLGDAAERIAAAIRDITDEREDDLLETETGRTNYSNPPQQILIPRG